MANDCYAQAEPTTVDFMPVLVNQKHTQAHILRIMAHLCSSCTSIYECGAHCAGFCFATGTCGGLQNVLWNPAAVGMPNISDQIITRTSAADACSAFQVMLKNGGEWNHGVNVNQMKPAHFVLRGQVKTGESVMDWENNHTRESVQL